MHQIIREIPNNYHTFALFDFTKMGNLLVPGKVSGISRTISEPLLNISQMLHATGIVAYFWLILILMKHVGKSSELNRWSILGYTLED